MKKKTLTILTVMLVLCMLMSTMFACGGGSCKHEYNNGECKLCKQSVFNGNYKQITTQEATYFALNLSYDGKNISWEDGYMMASSSEYTYDVLPENLNYVVPNKNYKINTALNEEKLVAYATMNSTAQSATENSIEESKIHFQNDRMYIENTEFLMHTTKTHKQATFDELLTMCGYMSTISDFNAMLQIANGGYYDNVEIYKAESDDCIKLKIVIPEQEKNGSKNSSVACYVYNKDYKLSDVYYELNMYYTGVNSKSVIKISKSPDNVPLVSNPETYECESHEYYAGICKNCPYNIFDNLSQLSFNQVSEQTFADFIENVKNNSSQGELSFTKYGAQIKYTEYDIEDSTKRLRDDVVKIKYADNVYKAEIVVDFYQKNITHKAYIVDKLIYSAQPNNLNSLGEITDCTNEEYNTILDNVRRATTYVEGYGVYSWDIVPANLPMCFEELYKPLSASYFYLQAGNYYIVKVVFSDQYMGDAEVVYVYDQSYDLLGFDCRNAISGYYDAGISIRPVGADVIIPEEIMTKINDYKS